MNEEQQLQLPLRRQVLLQREEREGAVAHLHGTEGWSIRGGAGQTHTPPVSPSPSTRIHVLQRDPSHSQDKSRAMKGSRSPKSAVVKRLFSQAALPGDERRQRL